MAVQTYDVLIIGSGASGGMAAYTLTKKGINCLMLDAGTASRFPAASRPQAGLRTALPRLRQAGPAAARLPGQRVQRQPVGRRSSRSRTRTIRRSLQLGPRPADRRQVAVLGADVVPPERLRIQGQRPRRLRRQLADQPTPTSRRSTTASSRSSASRAARKGWRSFPTASSSRTTRRHRAHRDVRRAGKQRGMTLTKIRRALGDGQLASSINLLLPDAHGDRQADDRSQRRRPRDHRRQEDRPGQRRALRRPAFGPRAARRRQGGGASARRASRARACC